MPLADHAIATLFSVLRANWHCLHTLQLRSTSLHVGDTLARLLSFLSDPMAATTGEDYEATTMNRGMLRKDDTSSTRSASVCALTALDLSGNLLGDRHMALIEQFLSQRQSPRSASHTITRLQVQQNRSSKSLSDRVRQLVGSHAPHTAVSTSVRVARPPSGGMPRTLSSTWSRRVASAGGQRAPATVKTLQDLARAEARDIAERTTAQAAGRPLAVPKPL